MITIRQRLVSSTKYSIKCPYAMTPIGICIHNTANDAAADGEIGYMISNDKQTSFHFAVDEKEVVQGLPLDRNGWHAGDGNGDGNRKHIGIEICYSKSGGERFTRAEQNAAELVAQLLKERKWGIERVKKHQDFSGKYCLPLDETELLTPTGWTPLVDIGRGDVVAQYNDGLIEFVEVEDVVVPYVAEVVRHNKLEATLDHRMLCKTQKQRNYVWKTWGDITKINYSHYIPSSGQVENGGIDLTDDEIAFLAWVQGDGHYMKRDFGYIGIEFHLSKQRKIDRLIDVLENIGWKYSHIIQSDQTHKIRLFGASYVQWAEKWLENKVFGWVLLNVDKDQADILIREAIFVDGNLTNNSYCSTKQQNYDVLQAIAATNGYRTLQCSTGSSTALTFPKSKMTVRGTDLQKRTTEVGCVTVPSGAVLIRQFGQPKVVGNCPHRTLDLGWDRFLSMVKTNMEGSQMATELQTYLGVSNDAEAKAKLKEHLGEKNGKCEWGSESAGGHLGAARRKVTQLEKEIEELENAIPIPNDDIPAELHVAGKKWVINGVQLTDEGVIGNYKLADA